LSYARELCLGYANVT